MTDTQVSVSPAATTPEVVLILNPTAGKGRAGRELVHLRSHFTARGIKADIFLTRGEGDGTRIMEELEPAPGTIVIAAGGDGTVHEIGGALIDKEELRLAVIPMGSGNDYARLMGMPNDPVQCLDLILEGSDQEWDVGLVGEEFFLNSVGFVLSSAVSWHSRQTGPLTGLARYGMAALRALSDHRPVRMGFDGLQASGDHWVSLLEVGIGDRAGGGYRLTPKANPTDGLLDVCLVSALARWRIPLLIPRARSGRHLNHPKVIYEQVAGFRLRLDARTLIHLDGELKRLEKGEYSVRVKSKSLRVRIPKDRALTWEGKRGGTT